MSSSPARSTILRKLQARRARPQATTNDSPQPMRWATADDFAHSMSGNGALITFEPGITQALQGIKRLCDDNDWLQPPVISPSIQEICKTQTWWETLNQDPTPIGTVAITRAFCGIADTGTLVCLSSPGNPTGYNFLPEHHIVLLENDHIVADKPSAWSLLHQQHTDIPRAINLISGPSRTADIEQTIQLGAHGPRSLTVVIIG